MAADLAATTVALHERGRLAFAAAAEAGLPGTFRACGSGRLRSLLTTSPGLSFLNTVSGVDEGSLPALPRVLAAFRSAGAPWPSLTGAAATPELESSLARLGYRRTAPAPIGLAVLPAAAASIPSRVPDIRVLPADNGPDRETFLDVLSRGYAASAAVTGFLLAEHAGAAVHRFLAREAGEPVAAAALSLHADVAVLGGATTLPDHRGSGAQLALLQHRLRVAAALGANLATATAAPESPSARNLSRAGFDVVPRPRWGHGG